MWFQQSTWRKAGVVAVVACGIMAWAGSEWDLLRQSALAFVLYWGVFLLLFGAAIVIVLIDVRYIRARYAIDKRDLFRDTLGDEAFRKTLREAQERKRPRE